MKREGEKIRKKNGECRQLCKNYKEKNYSPVKSAQDIRFQKKYRKLRKSGRPLKKYIFSAIFHR